jgi:RNA polymerase sigma-70 factor, ECF subfamily
MHQQTTTNLILLSRQNDMNAFRQLVESHQSMVFSLAFRLLCNENDAEDVVQETFVRVWKNLNKYKIEMKFSTWIYKITSNLCYDKLRLFKRNNTLRTINIDNISILNICSDENIEKSLINSELAKIITNLTNDLTPKQKLVFTLRDLEGIEVDEIEAITGLSSAKIKSNLFLARQYIRQKMETF